MGESTNLRSKLSLITVLVFSLCITAISISAAAEQPVGSGNSDWWTAYPDQSSEAGKEVAHPDWVLNALKEKPVLIYVHKGCSYCKPQTEAMGEIVDEYGSEFTYYDIAGDGSDARAEEATSSYDPDGGVSYVPLTVILTLAPDSEGEVQVVWHSTEEVTGKEWIKNYVQDAISYYHQNSADWKA